MARLLGGDAHAEAQRRHAVRRGPAGPRGLAEQVGDRAAHRLHEVDALVDAADGVRRQPGAGVRARAEAPQGAVAAGVEREAAAPRGEAQRAVGERRGERHAPGGAPPARGAPLHDAPHRPVEAVPRDEAARLERAAAAEREVGAPGDVAEGVGKRRRRVGAAGEARDEVEVAAARGERPRAAPAGEGAARGDAPAQQRHLRRAAERGRRLGARGEVEAPGRAALRVHRLRAGVEARPAEQLDADGGEPAGGVERVEEGDAVEPHERLAPRRAARPQLGAVVVARGDARQPLQRAEEVGLGERHRLDDVGRGDRPRVARQRLPPARPLGLEPRVGGGGHPRRAAEPVGGRRLHPHGRELDRVRLERDGEPGGHRRREREPHGRRMVAERAHRHPVLGGRQRGEEVAPVRAGARGARRARARGVAQGEDRAGDRAPRGRVEHRAGDADELRRRRRWRLGHGVRRGRGEQERRERGGGGGATGSRLHARGNGRARRRWEVGGAGRAPAFGGGPARRAARHRRRGGRAQTSGASGPIASST